MALFNYGGCSSIGRASACEADRWGFNSPHSPLEMIEDLKKYIGMHIDDVKPLLEKDPSITDLRINPIYIEDIWTIRRVIINCDKDGKIERIDRG